MSAVASQHPFPTVSKRNELAVPVVLAPSFFIIMSYSVYWGTGNDFLLSPALLLLVGLGALAYVARTIFTWKRQPLNQQVWIFCASVMVVYGQMLLPRFWGWPNL
ncbi:MAG: hypothetical protein ACQKBV_05275 [Puniceicoccales bacterium]